MLEKTHAELIQEVTDMVKTYNTELKVAQDLIKAKVDQSQIDELFKVDADITKTGPLDKMSKNIITLSDQLDKIQLKMKDEVFKEKIEPWIVTLAKSLQCDGFKKAANKEGKWELTFTTDPYQVFKATGITSTHLGGLDLNTAVVVPMREPGVFKAPSRPTTILDVISRGGTTSNQIIWAERIARTEGAAAVAEAGIFAESDFRWALKKKNVEKIGTFTKFSNESLDDWEYTLSEINTELISGLERTLEVAVVKGNGTSPNLDGILNRAVAYTYAGLNNKVLKCNLRDAITAMATQINSRYFQATHVALNIADIALLKTTKDSTGRYLFDYAPDGSVSIGGLDLITTYDDLLAAGEILVFDASKCKLFMRREITLEMFDQDSTDAEYDLRMIRAKLRAANRIRVCDYQAFVWDQYVDVEALIAKI